jgi:hypothetical protein
MELHTIGIDLGKTVFHLVGLNLRGEVVVRKKFSRTQLLRFTANVHVKLIGMEPCGGAHFLGRCSRSLATTAENMISCQVCWRIRRWHNDRTRRSQNPNSEEVSRD